MVNWNKGWPWRCWYPIYLIKTQPFVNTGCDWQSEAVRSCKWLFESNTWMTRFQRPVTIEKQHRSASHVIPAEVCALERNLWEAEQRSKNLSMTALEAIDPMPSHRPTRGWHGFKGLFEPNTWMTWFHRPVKTEKHHRSASHVIPAEACGRAGIYGRRNKAAETFQWRPLKP